MPPTKRAAKVRPKDKQETFEGLDYPPIEQRNKPPGSFDEYIRCFYGQKGFGKTTLVSSFPGHLTLMFEPRRRNLEIWQVNLQKRTAQEIMDGAQDVWAQIKQTTDRWIDDETIKGLNFDSIDICYETCQHSVCASHNVKVPGDAGKSSADIWLEIRDEWACYFDALAATRLGVNFVSHIKSRENEEIDGGKYDRKAPSCSPACLKYIMQACDFVFYYGSYNGQRAIQIRDSTNAAFVAAGVQGRFMQPDGKPISILAMPELADKKSGYQVLCEAFNNQHWDIDTPEDERGSTKPKPGPRKGPPKKG